MQHSFPEGRAGSVSRVALASGPVVLKVLLSVLGSGLLVMAGPVTLRTVADASLISIEILLELGRLGLAAFQIFGN